MTLPLALGWLTVALLGAAGARDLIVGGLALLARQRAYRGSLRAAMEFEAVREPHSGLKVLTPGVDIPWDWKIHG